MIHKCFALIVLARLSEAVTVANLDARHGSPEVLLGGGLECVARGDWHVYLNADQHTAGLAQTYLERRDTARYTHSGRYVGSAGPLWRSALETRDHTFGSLGD
jgi:hypothetical protein